MEHDGEAKVLAVKVEDNSNWEMFDEYEDPPLKELKSPIQEHLTCKEETKIASFCGTGRPPITFKIEASNANGVVGCDVEFDGQDADARTHLELNPSDSCLRQNQSDGLPGEYPEEMDTRDNLKNDEFRIENNSENIQIQHSDTEIDAEPEADQISICDMESEMKQEIMDSDLSNTKENVHLLQACETVIEEGTNDSNLGVKTSSCDMIIPTSATTSGRSLECCKYASAVSESKNNSQSDSGVSYYGVENLISTVDVETVEANARFSQNCDDDVVFLSTVKSGVKMTKGTALRFQMEKDRLRKLNARKMEELKSLHRRIMAKRNSPGSASFLKDALRLAGGGQSLSGRSSTGTLKKTERLPNNQAHMQLLRNLMNNKNIIIKKRDGSLQNKPSNSSKTLSAGHSFKDIMQTKKSLSPNELRLARLWKEWKEYNKNKNLSQTLDPGKIFLPGANKTNLARLSEIISGKPDVRNENVSVSAVSAQLNVYGSEAMTERRKPITPEVVFEESTELIQKKSSDTKLKWKNGKDTVYCKDCRIFMLRSSYHNHIKFVHEKVRKYSCQTCGYAACTGTILRQHVQAVHVGYSFFCDKCPKKFNLMKRLRKHIETYHSGKPIERNHICQYCAMAFAKPGCLKRHLRSHTQETPYQCQYCQRRFKYRWPKVQHERLHTGEKPYKCSFCEERFTQNCVRKTHEYKKHGNEEFKPKERIRKKKRRVTKKIEKEEESEASTNASSNSETESS